jgi:hypothetical protein
MFTTAFSDDVDERQVLTLQFLVNNRQAMGSSPASDDEFSHQHECTMPAGDVEGSKRAGVVQNRSGSRATWEKHVRS